MSAFFFFLHASKADDDKIQRNGKATIGLKLQDAQEVNCALKDERGLR